MADGTKDGRWKGGRAKTDRYGETTWVIEKMIDGTRYVKTLDVRSETDALVELSRFLDNPANYRTRTERRNDAASSTAAFSEELITRCVTTMGREEKSAIHIRSVAAYLAQWREAFEDRPLPTITLLDYRKALAAWPTAEKNRIIALRTFTSFLRREGLLKHTDDASLAIPVPKSEGTKDVESRAYPLARVEKIYRHIQSQYTRDVVLVSAKTGLHQSEIQRLASGRGELEATPDEGEIAAVLRVVHKSKRGNKRVTHAQSIDAQTYAAMRRLVERGGAPSDKAIHESIDYAAKKAGVQTIRPGQLRHCFITWSLRGGRKVLPKAGGVSIEDVRAAAGHATDKTTREHYAGIYIPPMLVPPVKLHHPEDPADFPARAASTSAAT